MLSASADAAECAEEEEEECADENELELDDEKVLLTRQAALGSELALRENLKSQRPDILPIEK